MISHHSWERIFPFGRPDVQSWIQHCTTTQESVQLIVLLLCDRRVASADRHSGLKCVSLNHHQNLEGHSSSSSSSSSSSYPDVRSRPISIITAPIPATCHVLGRDFFHSRLVGEMFVHALPRVHNEATVGDVVNVFKDLGVPEEKLSCEVHGSFGDFIDRHAELLLTILKCIQRPTKSLIETALAERFMNSFKGTRTTFASMVVSAVSHARRKGRSASTGSNIVASTMRLVRRL